ncbi:hypothetical protein NTE_00048 [Candidatus Nitrososphaera evergladensis SR1]|uniref:Uncharacterized protein n=1 Tax=Candidatus Nitrososphaera evergladensis SR1 TaxID=1459636 RepID=A0A075MMR2_9ARCH|nr:hypothetical protein [Candidatus Nitrososphaera evergladensis]AIF82132.1 hypothetical protein NTE_00048 [Candidatus Nitrososphaera evergladensis SR1]
MQVVTATTTAAITGSERHFALCESCFWSATVFGKNNNNNLLPACPSCMGENVSLIPLSKDEEYQVRVSPSAGVEMSFSRAKKA